MPKLDGHPDDLTVNPRIAGTLVGEPGWRLGGGLMCLKETVDLAAHMGGPSGANFEWTFTIIPAALKPFVILRCFLYITPIAISGGNLAFSMGTDTTPSDNLLLAFTLTTGQRATRGYKVGHWGSLLQKAALDGGGDSYVTPAYAPSIGGDSGGDEAGDNINMTVVRSGSLTVTGGTATCLVEILPILAPAAV